MMKLRWTHILVLCGLLATSGCGIVRVFFAMKDGSHHYKAAQRLTTSGEYAAADVEAAKAEAVFAGPTISKYHPDERYVALHEQLLDQLMRLRTALETNNGDDAAMLFTQSSQTCETCHHRNDS